jgi:hypothetical protein
MYERVVHSRQYLDLSSTNCSQVLKKIFANNESMDRIITEGRLTLIDFLYRMDLEPSKCINECDTRIHNP